MGNVLLTVADSSSTWQAFALASFGGRIAPQLTLRYASPLGPREKYVRPDPHSTPFPSSMLGKFRLIAELGRGGMSEVYLALVQGPAGFSKLLVVKLMKVELAEDPDFISMFLDEARLAARLNHPNVVQTNEVGEVAGRYYIAMEFLEGQPYSRVQHRLGRGHRPATGLSLGMNLRILCGVLTGLHYAHELTDYTGTPLGLVHRDVSPHNVFVTYDGQAKVVDFGIAKAMNSSFETRTGMLKGKVGYMAPEQARGERVDRRADIFSVGVMLWEAAAGRRLWKGLNEVQVLHQLMHGKVPSPRAEGADISPELDATIMRALSLSREERHATCAEFAAELEAILDKSGERASLREAGKRIGDHFSVERQRLGQIIDSHLEHHAAYPVPASRPSSPEGPLLPDLRHDPESDPPRTGKSPIVQSPGLHAEMNRLATPSSSSSPHWPTNHATEVAHVPVAHHSNPPTGSEPAQTGSIARANLASPNPRAASARPAPLLVIAALVLAALGGGVVALAFLQLGQSVRVPARAMASPKFLLANSTPAATSSADPSFLVLQVSVQPAGATLYLDDTPTVIPVGGIALAKDGKSHSLRLELGGYQTYHRTFEATGDLTVQVVMVQNGPTEIRKSAPSKPPPAAPQSGAGKMPINPQQRPIDPTYQ